MKSYAHHYSLLFFLSWILIYLIHPSWALPVSVTTRALLYFGLTIYFAASAYIMYRWSKSFSINTPVIIYPENLLKHIRDNIPLVIICCIAGLLHIYPILSPIYIVGDEALFLQGGLWIYDYFGAFWHESVKYVFWIAVVFALILSRKKTSGSPQAHRTGVVRYLLVVSVICFLVIYFILIRDLPYSITMLRYPPVHKFLYLFSYYILGINHVGPRMLQLLFYILSAIYLYRTINLFNDKETALLGASIYLFSPIIFSHARFAEVSSGVLFFIIIISYYFLRFIAYNDKRGLLLSSSLIGIGFLYKRDIFLMFFICLAYLVFCKVRKRELPIKTPVKILLLSLIPVIPWLIIGKFFNWRNAALSLSHFNSLHEIAAYFLLIPSQVSWIIFALFLFSIVFVLVAKRNHLSLFWGLLFVVFYIFYTAQSYGLQYPRFSMRFYPSIAVFLSIFIIGITQKVGGKHSFKLVFAVITIYFMILCTIPSLSAHLITYNNPKAQYFPSDKAMQWVKDNLRDGERILSLRFKADLFYRDKYGIEQDKIISFWYHLQEVSTPQKLKEFCNTNGVSYIIFPDGPNFSWGEGNKAIFDYLKENRNNEFIEAAKFNLGENYIFIYKLRDNW